MLTLVHKNYSTNIAKFAVSVKEELDKLPRIGTRGQDNLNTVKSCAQGSIAKVITGEDAGIYMLDGATNTWIKQNIGGGGSDSDFATDEEVEDILYPNGGFATDEEVLGELYPNKYKPNNGGFATDEDVNNILGL